MNTEDSHREQGIGYVTWRQLNRELEVVKQKRLVQAALSLERRENNALTHIARNMSLCTQPDGSNKPLTLFFFFFFGEGSRTPAIAEGAS